MQWLWGRAITTREVVWATRPSVFNFGYEYAIVLSIFLVILLGTVFTPLVTPFGCLYFYIQFWVVKYQFVYVLPHVHGISEFAQTASELVFCSLLLSQSIVTIALFQVANSSQCVAMGLLIVWTISCRLFRWHSDGRVRTPSLPITQSKTRKPLKNTTYSDPYRIGLFLFQLWNVNKFHEMETDITRLGAAFLRLKRFTRDDVAVV